MKGFERMDETKNELIEEKPKRTTKQKVFLGLEILGNVIFYLVIIALFLFAIFNINGGNGTENFPNLFGTGFLSVQSDSMKRSSKLKELEEWKDYEIGGFETGDLLKDSVFDTDDSKDLKVGMVITFYGKLAGTSTNGLITHRIVDVNVVNGAVTSVTTQGDAVAQLTPYIKAGTKRAEGMTEQEIALHNYNLEGTGSIENVELANIKGIVKSDSVGAGKVLDNIQQNYLFYFVIPVAVLLIFEIFLVVRNIMILRGEKNKAELEGTREAMLADVEAEKERMRQELLAEMRAQGLVMSEDKPKEEEKVEPEVKEEATEESKEEVIEEQPTDEVVENNEVEESNEDTTEVKEEKKETEEETSEE